MTGQSPVLLSPVAPDAEPPVWPRDVVERVIVDVDTAVEELKDDDDVAALDDEVVFELAARLGLEMELAAEFVGVVAVAPGVVTLEVVSLVETADGLV